MRETKSKKVKQDKYSAVWLSHSSSGDFLKCPRLYYLKNIYKNENGRKINIVAPAMSLGSTVHSVLEPLAKLPAEKRFDKNLLETYEENWQKFGGKIGGFLNETQENEYKEKGKKMLENVIANKGIFLNKTVKYYDGDFIPNIYLSEEDNIILCGLVDWIEYLPQSDSLRVIDFKTGKNEEKEDSYQLPIYKILVESLQKRKVSSAAYWYLDKDAQLTLKDADSISELALEGVREDLLEVGRDIKKRKENVEFGSHVQDNFLCKKGGCGHCQEFENIINKDASVEYVGVGEYKQDLYLVKR